MTPPAPAPTAPGPAAPPLTLAGLPAWKALLAADGAPPDPGAAAEADAAGLELLAAALLWSPGRLRFDDVADTPAARLWRRLGLDAPADATPLREDGRLVGLRLHGDAA